MQLIKFDPLKDFNSIEKEIDKMLKDGWNWVPELTQASALDVYEEDGNLITEVSLPQFKKEDIKVTVDGNGLEISASHSDKEESKKTSKRRYYRQETSQSYWRRVSLPPEAEWSKANAEFKDGMLNVKIPLDTSKTTKLLEIK